MEIKTNEKIRVRLESFNHELLNTFMVANNLSKIVTISVGGDDRLCKSENKTILSSDFNIESFISE